jgi:class 3 adenylate cyclase
MSTELETLRARVGELETWAALSSAADAALERLWRDRTSLRGALENMMPILAHHTGAARVEVHTLDEDLEWRDFSWGNTTALETQLEETLDVAGVDLGKVSLGFERALLEPEATRQRELLHAWIEVVDNYLASIALFRLKHQLIQETSEALKDPILDRGIERALAVLGCALELEQVLVLFRQEDEELGLRYQLLRPERCALARDEIERLLGARRRDLLGAGAPDLMPSLGFTVYTAAELRSGLGREPTVGRIYASSARGELNRFERDFLESFAAFLLQRVVDFNREWKHLSLCFPKATVSRLLAQPGYRERFLSAGEHNIAILYADISGFTRISEQVLKDPALIGRLIHLWSDHVVDRIWEVGGVFDKMVGDCVIALFGPPFYEESPAELCQRALQVAEATRLYTRTLNESELFPQLRGVTPPVGVAIGLNFCPAYVGHFGPNDGYTAFSAGMNNTARLQGLATRDEIAATEVFISTLGTPEPFGEPRSAKVKNVADALQYRVFL